MDGECTNCGHDKWDHFQDESYDSVIFGYCNVEGCDCEDLDDD